MHANVCARLFSPMSFFRLQRCSHFAKREDYTDCMGGIQHRTILVSVWLSQIRADNLLDEDAVLLGFTSWDEYLPWVVLQDNLQIPSLYA